MEFADVVRRRHMVRRFDGRPVAWDVLDRVVAAGLRAPSAGFTQGTDLIVLQGDEERAAFWRLTDRAPGTGPAPGGRREGMRTAPVVVIPLSDRQAYLDRYAEPDKVALGLDDEAAWPVPYWDIDAAFCTMAMLLAATDVGLGAVFFGIFHGEPQLLDHVGAPPGRRPVGALALGWPGPYDHPSPSLNRGERPTAERVHFDHW